NAPASAQRRNTRRGEKRSAMVSSAKASVPATKPACTAAVSQPSATSGSPQSRCRSAITPFVANQSEEPASCATAIAGRMRRGRIAGLEPGFLMSAGAAGAPRLVAEVLEGERHVGDVLLQQRDGRL